MGTPAATEASTAVTAVTRIYPIPATRPASGPPLLADRFTAPRGHRLSGDNGH